MERWLSCWVRGPIMEVGWMDMVCSRPGVRTVPCGRRGHAAQWLVGNKAQGGAKKPRESEGGGVGGGTHCGRHDVGLVMQPGGVVHLQTHRRQPSLQDEILEQRLELETFV